MSFSRPAWTCSAIPPPPQLWNRSGTLPPARSVASFALKASFSRTVMLTFTLGCAAVYSSARACQSDRPGSLFWMWYQSISTGSSATDGARTGSRSDGAVEARRWDWTRNMPR